MLQDQRREKGPRVAKARSTTLSVAKHLMLQFLMIHIALSDLSLQMHSHAGFACHNLGDPSSATRKGSHAVMLCGTKSILTEMVWDRHVILLISRQNLPLQDPNVGLFPMVVQCGSLILNDIRAIIATPLAQCSCHLWSEF